MTIWNKNDIRLAGLRVRAEMAMAPLIHDFLCGTARVLGIAEEDIIRLGTLIDDVCRYVIDQSFDPDENGHFHLTLWRRTDRIELVVEDRGRPIDLEAGPYPDPRQNALLALRAHADEVQFHNLGKEGKRLEFSLRMGAESIEQILAIRMGAESAEQIFANAPTTNSADMFGEEAIILRMATPDDAVNIAQCVYRNYGLSYYRPFLYYPAKIAAKLESGELESCIAVTSSGRIVGHLAVFNERPGARVCETGVAVVEPRYRGHRLFEQMKAMVRKRAIENGHYGIYSDAMTVHPYSQRSNLVLGARETGIMLANVPDRMLFKSIKETATVARQSNMLFFLGACPVPVADVYLPEHHAAIIEEIYTRLDLPRQSLPVRPDIFETARGLQTQFNMLHKPEIGLVFLQIHSYGSDALLVVHNTLRDLRANDGIACVYLDLPLRDPLTGWLCRGMEVFGFSFCGVLIEYDRGDVLRLQYLNKTEIRAADITVASDFGRKLVDYALEQKDTISRNTL